jgi:hypothetical protein
MCQFGKNIDDKRVQAKANQTDHRKNQEFDKSVAILVAGVEHPFDTYQIVHGEACDKTYGS